MNRAKKLEKLRWNVIRDLYVSYKVNKETINFHVCNICLEDITSKGLKEMNCCSNIKFHTKCFTKY